MRNYSQWEVMEEAFREVIVCSVCKRGETITVPVLEEHPAQPGLQSYRANRTDTANRQSVLAHPKAPANSDYGVVSFVESDVYGSPSTQVRRVRQQLELILCDIQSLIYTVEFCGLNSRDLAYRSKLWLESDAGADALLKGGFSVQDISGVRALYEMLPTENEWERRAQFDVSFFVTFVEAEEYRQKVGIVEKPVLTVMMPGAEINELNTVGAVSFQTGVSAV